MCDNAFSLHPHTHRPQFFLEVATPISVTVCDHLLGERFQGGKAMTLANSYSSNGQRFIFLDV